MRISDWSSDVCSSDLPARQITIAQATLPRDERLFHSVNEDLFRRGGQLQRIAVPDHDIRPPARLQASKLGSKPHDLGGRSGNFGDRLSPVQSVPAGHPCPPTQIARHLRLAPGPTGGIAVATDYEPAH